MRRSPIIVMVAVLAAVSLVAAGVIWWVGRGTSPLPLEDRCVAVAGGQTVAVDLEQAHNAAIIAGVAIMRDLPPRAVSIALATAYQESGIRNLDHGHADSIGLFQQRPSKGWGTIEQIMDPYYSSRAFYRALVRVKNWQTRDLNDVAQAVQRSAYPQAYRKHVANARTLASSLSGQTPASLSCVVNRPSPADPSGLSAFLATTLKGEATLNHSERAVTITAKDARTGWAAAAMAVTGSGPYGVATVTVGGRTWTHDRWSPASWVGGDDRGATTVTVGFGS